MVRKELTLKVKGIYEKLDESGKNTHVDTQTNITYCVCKKEKCTEPAAATRESARKNR